MNVFPFDPASAGSLVTIEGPFTLAVPPFGWHHILGIDNTRLFAVIYNLVPATRVYVLPYDGGPQTTGIGGEQTSNLLIHSFFYPGITQGDIYVFSDGTADIRYITGVVRH